MNYSSKRKPKAPRVSPHWANAAQRGSARLPILLFFAISFGLLVANTRSFRSQASAQAPQNTLSGQSQQDVDRKSSGCVSCHTATDEPSMHPSKAVHLACTDCHGGNSINRHRSRHRIHSCRISRRQRKSSRPTARSLAQESLRPSRSVSTPPGCANLPSTSSSSIPAIFASLPKPAALPAVIPTRRALSPTT